MNINNFTLRGVVVHYRFQKDQCASEFLVVIMLHNMICKKITISTDSGESVVYTENNRNEKCELQNNTF